MTYAQSELARDCPICGFEASYAFTSKHSRKIYRCANSACGHFFTPITKQNQGMAPRSASAQEESDEYLAFYGERNKMLLSLFKRNLRSRRKPVVFLDFGSGSGHISRVFKREMGDNALIYCLEADPHYAGIYAKYDLIEVKSIDSVADALDLVYMIEVIEHLDDPITVLKSLRSKISTDGILFLSTPLGREQEAMTNAFDDQSHVHFFTPSSLNIALSAAGFQPIEFRLYPEMYVVTTAGGGSSGLLSRLKALFKGVIFGAGEHLRTEPEAILRPESLSHLAGFTSPK